LGCLATRQTDGEDHLPVALRFGRIEVRPDQRQVLVDGRGAPIAARAYDVLWALIQHRDRVISKSELLDCVWPGVVVEEHNLHTQVSSLRKVIGAVAIATIPGRGYRFVAIADSDIEQQPTDADGDGATPGIVPTEAAATPFRKLNDNLPATLTPLLGRVEDLAALHGLIDQHRLVTIIGAGGMGKTTVAQHLIASRRGSYRHGVCSVELTTIVDAEVLPSAIGRAIGVHVGDGEPLAGLCNALRPLTMLVALDSAEQVVDGLAHVVQAVLDRAPALRFVVTSQAPLKLAAEHTYRIGALAVPQGPLPAAQALEFGAVALFTERAQAADARFSLSETNAPAVIDLCGQLDGMPLAIELAASRAPSAVRS
jgi:DNA-binding winged helix-turn-helix (wHTH) protein